AGAPPRLGDRELARPPSAWCAEGARAPLTPRQTAGPFYRPNAPERRDLSADGEGRLLVLTGRLLTPDCRPVAGALLDVWHADPEGRYDTHGHRFRGRQFTDAGGVYRLTTLRPARYGQGGFARPAHIHAKAEGPKTRLLTTQIYLPGEPAGADRIFDPALVMDLTEQDGVLHGRFDIVLRPSENGT
ncbi:MAG: hypothetical protein MI723_13555, partial [Caulobacterales bacterium]|nr:hypothetical protein [Caulobacterales bacterium]